MLISLGCSKTDAKSIAQAIMDFIQKGTPFHIGDDEDRLKGIAGKHGDNMSILKEQRKREMEELRK